MRGGRDTRRVVQEPREPAVRQPISVEVSSRRRVEERLALRFPRLLAVLVRAVLWALPPRSRLRRLLTARAVKLSGEAVNRGDYEASFLLWDADCEATFPAQMTTLGVQAGTRGRQARVDFQRRWSAEWGSIQFEPDELIDLGGRVLVLGRVKGSGLGSGAAFDNEWALLVTISWAAGRVIREQVFLDHHEALEAAGLSESRVGTTVST